jgi:AraC-like DNA-binding protein
MKTLVPIVGHEFFDDKPDLKNRVGFLLNEKGYEAVWINDKSAMQMQIALPSEVYVPAIINLCNSDQNQDHIDIVIPLSQHFSASQILTTTIDSLPRTVFEIESAFFSGKLNPSSEIIHKVIQYCISHIGDAKLPVEKIAHAVFVSKNTLEIKFKKWYGFGVSHFIRMIRIEQAKRILQESDNPVAEVASSVGYPDFRSFDKAFKSATRLTPLQYRRKSRGLVKKTH